MKQDILIIYSTTDGHTVKICERIMERLQESSRAVTLHDISSDEPVVLTEYRTVVIGASIRYGKHNPKVFELIASHRHELDARKTAFFTVNIVARKAHKNTPSTNPYMKKFLKRSGWQADLLGVFAGRLEYPRYGFIDRTMIRFIMLITGGPTAPDTVVEYTDWNEVDRFAGQLASL